MNETVEIQLVPGKSHPLESDFRQTRTDLSVYLIEVFSTPKCCLGSNFSARLNPIYLNFTICDKEDSLLSRSEGLDHAEGAPTRFVVA